MKLGVCDVYLQKGWIEDARRDFEKAAQNLGGMMPTLHPVDVCEKFRMGNYEVLPLLPGTSCRFCGILCLYFKFYEE